MSAYYNEHDRFAAAWLRELIAAELIAAGDVDERDIQEVTANDVRPYTQAHFFAGIGGWSHALRLAGWPDDRPVWTGSCPCQPFSSAGAKVGGHDDRHLWPYWAGLIVECHPVAIFGEQVESAIAHGWIDSVFDDLEREGYSCGATCLPAASVGAPHGRQRLWFVGHLGIVADAESGRSGAGLRERNARAYGRIEFTDRGSVDALADSDCARRDRIGTPRVHGRREATSGDTAATRNPDGPFRYYADRRGEVGELADAERNDGRADITIGRAEKRSVNRGDYSGPGDSGSFWANAEWLDCRDGQRRPIEPGTFPLAYGVPARVGRLRGYGNAIVPQVAAEVIRAYLDVTS